jgi:hypothetical protein
VSEPNPSSIARIKGEWIEADVWHQGELLQYRIRAQKPPKADQYPHLLVASWQGESSPRQQEFEARLVGWLEGYKVAWLLVSFTTQATTEWYWYARNPEECMNLINLALEEAEAFPVEFSLQDDTEWAVYEEIRGQIKG